MLNRITICSSNSTTGYLSKKMKTIIQKDICTPIFIAALFIIAKIWKQPNCPLTDERIKKMWCILHGGILLNHKKKEKK